MTRSCWKPHYDYLLNKLPKDIKKINIFMLKGIRKATILPKHINLILPSNLQKGKIYYSNTKIRSKMVGLKFGSLILTKRIAKPKKKKN